MAPNGSGPYVDISPFNVHCHFIANGTPTDVGFRFLTKGTGGYEFMDVNANNYFAVSTQSGGSSTVGTGFTSVSLRHDNVLKGIEVGATNSGGTGYRMLRVIN